MKIGDNVVLRGTIKGVTYGEYGFPHYLVTLANGCETEFPKPYIDDLQQLNEPKRVKVPQEIADEIEYYKKNDGYGLFCAMDDCYEKHKDWFNRNEETFARAWLDGYEVEKEKRYTVVMKKTKQPLYYNAVDKKLFFSMGGLATKFTRKELEEAGFGWVFDCEGIEIEEVEG